MFPKGIPVWGNGAILDDAWFILLSQMIVTLPQLIESLLFPLPLQEEQRDDSPQ